MSGHIAGRKQEVGMKLLKIGQVAEVLVKSPKTVYNYLEAGTLDCGFKIGNEWRIDEQDLWTWIQRKKQVCGVLKIAR